MGSILSAEFFKLRKERITKTVFFVNFGLALFFSLMLALMAYHFGDTILYELDSEETVVIGMEGLDGVFGGEGASSPSSGFTVMYQIITILTAVLAGFFVCAEFDTGTIRNTLSVGKSRVKYYFSKMVTISLYTIILAAIATGLWVAFYIGFFGFDAPSGYAVSLLWLVLGQMLIYLTYTSIFIMLAFLFRSMVATLVTAIAFAALLESILLMILQANFMSNFEFISHALPLHNIFVFTGAFEGSLLTYAANCSCEAIALAEGITDAIGGFDLSSFIDMTCSYHDRTSMQEWFVAAVVCVVTIIITTVIGAYTFAKRDVR